ncbi:hypothetical protein HPP92_017355 [Vanilla planifolia]|uniref:TORTIFOLIA1/SINE1-2 N-terminal domain-containing protein n=1 Tax=Vanilla planifolia TaxID=51239 RepID=A0A835QHK9_VANPL|nr:hypothetical protein HPP92_017355 [Vanilla planifolia]
MARQQQSTRQQRPEEMRQRVNLFMSKLSDRDTEAMAAAELESIARGLTADSLAPFLSAVSDTRPSDKTPLRRHSLRLLSVLTHSLPPSALAPHVSRILSAALRRLRDPDSSVRNALVQVARSLAAASPPSVLVNALLRPLADALFLEQDLHSQSASALSLSAALDEVILSTAADIHGFLNRLVPRLVKLARSPAFKAKPAILALLGSAAAAGGISGDGALQALVPCLLEFLGNEDWAARKAAAEALTRVATVERDRLVGFKPSCLASFEGRRYDKVKIVRDSMNRMLEVWKEIPDEDLNSTPPSESQASSSLKENATTGCFPGTSINRSSSVQSSSSLIASKGRLSTSRSPPPSASPIPCAKKILIPTSNRKPNPGNKSDWKVAIVVPDASPPTVVCETKQAESKERGWKNGEQGINGTSSLESRRLQFEKNCEEKKIGGLKSGSRVVPFQENGSLEVADKAGETGDVLNGRQKDSDMSLIRRQLVQIENQQSSLLELLQRFIGSSQNGIQLLERRVQSLEMTLDEISRDLAAPTRMVSNDDPVSKTCCRLPGTDFLSSKFWKRGDGRYNSRFLTDMHDFGNRDGHEAYNWGIQKLGLRSGFMNPLAAETNPQARGSVQLTSTKVPENMTSTGGKRFELS